MVLNNAESESETSARYKKINKQDVEATQKRSPQMSMASKTGTNINMPKQSLPNGIDNYIDIEHKEAVERK